MTLATVLDIMKAYIRPDFYGDVTVRVKDGGVTAVDVRQTFVEKPKQAA